MLCQAKRIGLRVGWVPVGVNLKTRNSRLFKSNFEYVFKQSKIMIMVFLEYYPLAFFSWTALFLLLVSMVTGLGNQLFLFFFASQEFRLGLWASLSLKTSILFMVAGMIGSVLSSLHFLLIDIRSRVRVLSSHRETVLEDFDVKVSPEFFKWAKKGN